MHLTSRVSARLEEGKDALDVLAATFPAGTVSGAPKVRAMFHPFVDDASVRLIGVEAAGTGETGCFNSAPLNLGTPGVLHGAYSMLLQNEDGQVEPSHSISAGLDYPGVGPEHSWLQKTGRVHYGMVGVLYLMFQVTFTLGAYPQGWVEDGFKLLGSLFTTLLPEGLAQSLIVDGIIAGVGSVVSFVPLILIMFALISFMEDSGYMTAFDISASGLAADRTRINTISMNLANAKTTRTPQGGPYRRRSVVQQTADVDDPFSIHMGPAKLSDVEAAQQNVVKIVRRLEGENKLVISRGGGDVFV